MKKQLRLWYYNRMHGKQYVCNKCRNVFSVQQLACSITGGHEVVACPACGSHDTAAVPVWEPIGFHSHEEVREWEYQCQDCKKTFKLPVPSSPSEERSIRCPDCGSDHIHRLTLLDGVPMYCG